MKVYKDKKLCKVCKEYYHPAEFEMCWNCWSKQLKNTTKKYKKGGDKNDR